MSQTVSTVSSLSRVGLFTAWAKSRTVRGSARSRFWATSDISRWFRTSQTTSSVSSASRPKRGQSRAATSAPSWEWSRPEPLPMSWSRSATKRILRSTPLAMMSVATGSSFDELAPLDLAGGRDRADDVLVDRVVVVHVELHHRHDAAELGDEGTEDADLVHQPQRPLGVMVAEQQVQEDAVGLGRGAHGVVDQLEARGDPAQRVGVDRGVAAELLLEQAQDVDRVLAEGVLVGEVEAAVLELVAGGRRVLAEGEDRADLLAEARAGLDVARLERGEEDARQVAHMLGVGEIVLHEALDRALALGRR